MPRFKLTWSETVLFEAEVTAKDKLRAKQMWENWESEVSDSCEEVKFIDKSDVEIEEVNANTNSID